MSELPGFRRGAHPLVYLLAAASITSATATLLVPGLLTGPAVMNGSAKGTALVVLLAGTPMLLAADRKARAGHLVGLAMTAGASAYLAYNAVLLVFATPLNRAFPVYEAMLGLAVWVLANAVWDIWMQASGFRPSAGRWTAAYILIVVLLNAAAWARRLIPALIADDPHSALTGTGLPTNPVYVQDLAIWLPVIAWLGVGTWKAHGPRTVLAASALCYWVLESVSIAVDQWWGHHADPASAVASGAATPLFVLVGLFTLWPLHHALVVVARGSRRPPSANDESLVQDTPLRG